MSDPVVLLDRVFARSLDGFEARIGAETRPGEVAEAWMFEDEAPRRAAEARLAASGVKARIRCALKPLVHAFLEDIEREGLAAVTVRTPAHAAAAPRRFSLEAYPLAPLLAPADLAFERGAPGLDHAVTWVYRDGRRETRTVFAPNRVVEDAAGEPALAVCGWLRIGPPAGPWRIDEPVETEYEAVFRAIMDAVAARTWPADEPLFDRLAIEVEIPAIRRPLGWRDEVVDSAEALHEELYFSLLEQFRHAAGVGAEERHFRPGQIVPDVRAVNGPARVRVAIETFGPDRHLYEDAAGPLHAADRPLAPARIAAALARLPGSRLEARSREGRPVLGVHVPGDGPSILVTAGQHANETTGIVGALRAAERLLAAGRDFALIALENPDGYALHHRLRAANPRHMHHAARYTALGDDIEYRNGPPFFETAARNEAIARTGARLHINMHGYPAHEWIRPLSGYVPRGFGLWAVPKGFFLILRHHPGLDAAAEYFLERLSARLAFELPDMIAFNAAAIAAYRAHVGEIPFRVRNGIPCQIGASPGSATAFQLITEYPDETIYGDAFRLGHTTQMHAALAAAEIFGEDMA